MQRSRFISCNGYEILRPISVCMQYECLNSEFYSWMKELLLAAQHKKELESFFPIFNFRGGCGCELL